MRVQGTKVFLNGKWIGVHRNPDELKSALLTLRRQVSITEDVSIVYDHALGEMRIYNDWGRVCRPLYVVENSAMKITKGDIPALSVRPPLAASLRPACACVRHGAGAVVHRAVRARGVGHAPLSMRHRDAASACRSAWTRSTRARTRCGGSTWCRAARWSSWTWRRRTCA